MVLGQNGVIGTVARLLNRNVAPRPTKFAPEAAPTPLL